MPPLPNLSGTDRSLARRIEQGHADSGRAANTNAAIELVAGGVAIFGGLDLPSTQALNVGMNGPITSGDLDRLEAFFHSRGSAAVIDLCSLADPTAIDLIQRRGYTLREITNVLARRIDVAEQFPPAIPGSDIQQMHTSAEIEHWARIVARGFTETETPPEDQVGMMTRTAPNLYAYLASLNGVPSAGAAMVVDARMATLVGDATVLPVRGRGLQTALIYHRLRQAAALDCDLASASVWPGTASHRNYERAGFQLLYARVMLALPIPPPAHV